MVRYCVVSRKTFSSGSGVKYSEVLQCFVGVGAKVKAKRYAKHERLTVHPRGSQKITVRKYSEW